MQRNSDPGPVPADSDVRRDLSRLNTRWSGRAAAAAALVLALTAAGAAAGAQAADFTSRESGPGEAEMLARGDQGLTGLAFVRPVLSGVLYRAGFKGGDRAHAGLAQDQRLALCEAGFSGARYADFGTKTTFGTTACAGNSLDYEKTLSGNTRDLMRDIHAVIEDRDKGPILVHCMWGVHSSGAISAMALVQFCGWSEERAKTYWNAARNGAPCGAGGCDAWIDDKFERFAVDPDLAITEDQRKGICPR